MGSWISKVIPDLGFFKNANIKSNCCNKTNDVSYSYTKCIHVRSHQHMNNIRKLPMKIGEEWWTMKTEDLFNYLNKNAIEKYNGNKHLANLPV